MAIRRHEIKSRDRIKASAESRGDNIARIEHTVKASGSVSEGGNAEELIKPFLPLRSPQVIAAAIVNLKQDSEPRRNGEAVT